MTYAELEEKLRSLDELTLLEMLRISSDDIVERFSDWIERDFDALEENFQSEEDEDYA